jgi:hypothetical protein
MGYFGSTPSIPLTTTLPDPSDNSFLQSLQKLNPLIGGLGDLGSVLGSQAKGDETTAAQQGLLNQGANSNAISLYNSQNAAQNQQAQTDLERKQFTNTNRATTAKQALIGALLGGGYQPISFGANGVTGGLANSLKSNPQSIAAMQDLYKQARTAQDTPLTFTGGNPVATPTLAATPNLAAAGGTKSTAGGFLQDIGAIGGSLLKALPALLAL